MRRTVRRTIGVALAVVVAISTIVAAARAQDRPRAESRSVLWIFFSPGQDLSADLRELARQLKQRPDIRVQPCLLLSDARAIESPPPAFGNTLKELPALSTPTPGVDPGLLLLDEDGFALARRIGIDSLPAWALVTPSGRRSQVRLCYGASPRWKELLPCK